MAAFSSRASVAKPVITLLRTPYFSAPFVYHWHCVCGRRSGKFADDLAAWLAGQAHATACAARPTSFTCPVCGRTSYHPQDIAAGYCGACHRHTAAETGELVETFTCPTCGRVIDDPGDVANKYCGVCLARNGPKWWEPLPRPDDGHNRGEQADSSE